MFVTLPHASQWAGLRCVIVVFPDHTHLLFLLILKRLSVSLIIHVDIYITMIFYVVRSKSHTTGLVICCMYLTINFVNKSSSMSMSHLHCLASYRCTALSCCLPGGACIPLITKSKEEGKDQESIGLQ